MSKKALVALIILCCASTAFHLPAPHASRDTLASPTQEGLSASPDIREKILKNGLTLLVGERRGSGLVSVNLAINCGSALEEDYLGTGMSHLAEHMVFKGTKTRPPGAIEREVRSYGASINGTTTSDVTSFQLTAQPEYLPKILELLKDMMENTSFPADELTKEKDVIIKEMRMNGDDPEKELLRLLWEVAYLEHPYKLPVIGYEELFESLKREDLVRYYKRMYVPNRVVVAIVGDIEGEVASGLAEDVFRDMGKRDYRSIQIPQEPPQLSRRSLERPFDTKLAYSAFGYHSTRLLDDDLFKLDVLAMILGQGDNSRLNKALFKEKRLVHTISSYNYTPKDAGLFLITAISNAETVDRIEGAVREEAGKLKDELVSDEELERAKKGVTMSYISSRQTTQELAQDMAFNKLLTGSYDFSSRYVRGVQGVTKKDVRDAARKYLRDDNLTLVKLVPRTQREKSPRAQTEALSQGQETVVREVLPNGIRVIARQNRGLPMISLTVSCLGGLRAEDEKTNGISHLVSRLLLKGTSKRREEEIAGAVEARGGSLEAFSGLNSFGVSLRCLKDDADFCLDLVKDILSDSVVPEGEIEKEKTLALAQIKSEEDDIFEKGVHVFRKALFKAHPYGFRIAGEPDTLKALGRGDLLQFYKRWCVPANIVIAVSGDADPRGFIEKARALFSDMKRADPPRVSTPPAAPSSEKTKFEMAKDQTLILLGYKTVTLGDPDRFTFEVLASILSGSNGRLFEDLRGRFGLAYALGVTQIFGMDPGYFAFYVATTRDKCESVRKGLLDEILELRTKGVSDEEVEHAKRELITAHRTSLQTNEFVSSQMALDELYGLGYDSIYHYDEQIARVTAEEIKRVAKKYFDASAYTEVIINPGR